MSTNGVDLFDLAQKEREAQATFRGHVLCCGSTACLSGGAQATRDAFDAASPRRASSRTSAWSRPAAWASVRVAPS
jgi:hypothetical protein